MTTSYHSIANSNLLMRDALDTMKKATARVNRLKQERAELIEALEDANSRLLSIRLKQEDTLRCGLAGFGNLEEDLEMTVASYEKSKTVLKKYRPMAECNGKCKPTVMQYDDECPIHGYH